MSQIRTAKAGDVGAFPGSTFVVDGSPPIAQCQETQITLAGGLAVPGEYTITKVGLFAGINLAGKKVTLTAPPGDVGTFNILSNTDDVITTDHQMVDGGPVYAGTIHDAAQAYLTRNESSFQRFIEAQAKAHTTKGGQLFTDLADPPMDDACSDTWAPE